jgi:hypothetical protein
MEQLVFMLLVVLEDQARYQQIVLVDILLLELLLKERRILDQAVPLEYLETMLVQMELLSYATLIVNNFI